MATLTERMVAMESKAAELAARLDKLDAPLGPPAPEGTPMAPSTGPLAAAPALLAAAGQATPAQPTP